MGSISGNPLGLRTRFTEGYESVCVDARNPASVSQIAFPSHEGEFVCLLPSNAMGVTELVYLSTSHHLPS